MIMAIICRQHKLIFIMVPGTGCSSLGKILIDNFEGEWIPEEDIFRKGKRVVNQKHNSIKSLVKYNLISRFDLPLYLKFATIRNPFDRIVTMYQRATGKWIENFIESKKSELSETDNRDQKIYLEKFIKAKMTSSEWAKRVGFDKWLEYQLGLHTKTDLIVRIKSHIKSLIDPYHSLHRAYPLISGVDELMRFENLEEDFNTILKKSGIIRPDRWVNIPNINPTPGKKAYQEYYTAKTRALVEKTWRKELKMFNYSFDE